LHALRAGGKGHALLFRKTRELGVPVGTRDHHLGRADEDVVGGGENRKSDRSQRDSCDNAGESIEVMRLCAARRRLA
jgi:hypothetical protein